MDEPVQPLALSYAVGAGDTAVSLAETTATGSIFGEVRSQTRNLVMHVILFGVCGVNFFPRVLASGGPGLEVGLGQLWPHTYTVFALLVRQSYAFNSV